MTLSIINMVASIAAAAGTILAGVALLLNYWQFRRIEGSIRGNTYQQLSTFALEFHRLLLEHPELNYLYTANAPDAATRKQRIFDRILANYLENLWLQCDLGLLRGDVRDTYEEMLRMVLLAHPGVAEHMTQPNFAKGLRQHVQEVLRRHARATPPDQGGPSTQAKSVTGQPLPSETFERKSDRAETDAA